MDKLLASVGAILPLEDTQLLLGNDLPYLLMTVKLCAYQIVDPLKKKVSYLYPACSATRCISKKAIELNKDIEEIHVDLSDTFCWTHFKRELEELLSTTYCSLTLMH